MADLIGRKLGRYHVVDLIGAGGMGEVYRATDTELGRQVAVKVVSGGAADTRRALDRFEREARTVAQLSHPNILEIHDFGRSDGVVYAVTELLEGGDLRSRMRRGEMPLSKVKEIAIAVASGLSAAHDKGIVHRDIKPENVFLTASGQVKILDFGIAALKEAAVENEADPDRTTQTLTHVGSVVGTVGYMSPEQVRGEPVDPRSDIFAFGCLLYEMLAGRRAFKGQTSDEVIRAILDRDPEPISEIRSDVPRALELIVARCLEKQPAERFESARDVAFALQALTGPGQAAATPGGASPRRSRGVRLAFGAAAVAVAAAAAWWLASGALSPPPPLPPHLSVAVVPFEVDAGDAGLESFAAGLRLCLIDDLALVAQQERGISWVVPADEAARAGSLDAADLGRDYGTSLAVAGRLETAGAEVRLTLLAEDPTTGETLRSVVIEDVPSNVEAFQHGPARRLADALGVAIDPATDDRIEACSTTTTGAFDLYVRGRGTLARAATADDVEDAASMADRVVAEDPLFAGGWILRARCRLGLLERSGDRAWLDPALADARHALTLAGRPEAAWRAAAAIEAAAGHQDLAVDALEQAVRAAPDDADLRLELADALQRAGRPDDAERQLERAIYLRPDYWVGYDRLAKLHLSHGDLERAAVEFGHVISCAPDFALGYVKLAGTYMYLERPDAAQPLLERSLEIQPTPWALTNLGSIHFDASRFAKAAEYYRASLELRNDDSVLWGNLGYAYRYGAEPDRAEEAFRRAAELAEARLVETPDDLELETALAGYCAMLGDRGRGLELLDRVIDAAPTNPLVIQQIAETYEDLGERELALEWVARSFDAGIPPERFEHRPTLSKLVADERYQALVSGHTGAP